MENDQFGDILIFTPEQKLACGASYWEVKVYFKGLWKKGDPDWKFVYHGPASDVPFGGFENPLVKTGRSSVYDFQPHGSSAFAEVFVGDTLVKSGTMRFTYRDGSPIDRTCNFARAELAVTKKPTSRRPGSIRWIATGSTLDETEGPAKLILKSKNRKRVLPVTLRGNDTMISLPRLRPGRWTAEVTMPTNETTYEVTSSNGPQGGPVAFVVRR